MIIEARTRNLIKSYARKQHQAVLLHGPEGVGLLSVADQLRRTIDVPKNQVLNIIPKQDMQDISIEQIRQLYSATRSIRADKIIVLIDEADRMSREAQNALLKLIEEPPTGAKFILTTHHRQLLLPTILSRVVGIDIQPVSLSSSKNLIDSLSGDQQRNDQVLFLAKGLPAKITRLLSDDDYFDSQVATVRDAKTLLTGDQYTKHTVISRYSKDRSKTMALLTITSQLLAHTAYRGTAEYQKMLGVSETIDNIKANGNLRIQLLWLINQL